jgi:hypothetical protein
MLDACITNNNASGPIASPIKANEMLSPTHMFSKNQFSKLNESLNLNPATMQDDLNNYLKHQFYGSPVTRQVNKFNDCTVNSKHLNQKFEFDYSNIRTSR